MSWQPIETAPRDGTRVLLAKRNEVLGIGDFWGADRAEGTTDAWFVHNGAEIAEPTHWQPLPEPPLTSQAVPAALPPSQD